MSHIGAAALVHHFIFSSEGLQKCCILSGLFLFVFPHSHACYPDLLIMR